MIKTIISKTILFIGILLFITVYKGIFGNVNTLVGVTTLIIALVLMGDNLTKKPVKNFLILLIMNLVLGLLSIIASTHIFLGVILNFLVLASIGYFLSYNLSKSVIVPFGLQYLFMLYTPVSGVEVTQRICGLIAAPIFVMIIQFIIHSKKSKEMNIEIKESDILDFEEKVNPNYKIIKIFGKNVKVHIVRLAYGIRVGTLVAITTFIEALLIKYFNLYEGRWMVFTIFSLTELYSENCKVRSKDRLQGTIIGSIIVLVLFMFIRSTTLRGLILLLAGYLNPFCTNYRDTMIIVTIAAIGSVAITDGAIITAVERIIFVTIGVFLALLGNKYIPEPKI